MASGPSYRLLSLVYIHVDVWRDGTKPHIEEDAGRDGVRMQIRIVHLPVTAKIFTLRVAVSHWQRTNTSGLEESPFGIAPHLRTTWCLTDVIVIDLDSRPWRLREDLDSLR